MCIRDRTSKVDPIPDIEILELIGDLPSSFQWVDMIKLSSVYGLRPAELRHLHVRVNPVTGDDFMFCSYEKRSSRGSTKPRKIMPLLLRGGDGEYVDWNLLERLKNNDIDWAYLDAPRGVSLNFRQQLDRRPAWVELRKKATSRGQRLGIYSFRHSYSVRGHQRGIDTGSMSLAMGHSIKIHCASYPWATETGMEAAFDRAR